MIIFYTISTVVSIIPVILFATFFTIMTIRFKALGSRVGLKMSKFRQEGCKARRLSQDSPPRAAVATIKNLSLCSHGKGKVAQILPMSFLGQILFRRSQEPPKA